MKFDLLTNATVVDDAIRFVSQKSQQGLESSHNNNEESDEPDYDEDKGQLEEEQEDQEETGEAALATTTNKYPYTSREEYCLLDSRLFLNKVLNYKTEVTPKKSVFSLMALLTLATLITGATSFQPTLAQPIMDDTSIGNAGSSGMDFNPISFANNLSNASSLYGSVGISMVNGVKVTSINLLENNEISVTLRHFPAGADTSNSLSATTMSSALPPRVTVTAIRVPMNLKDLMSLASSESSKMMTGNMSTTMSNPMMMGGGPLQGFGGAAGNGTNNFNPLSFLLTDLQIGSSTVANADWSSPQIVRMGLTGMMGSTNNNTSATSTADFIIVSVIPYTGKSTTTNSAG